MYSIPSIVSFPKLAGIYKFVNRANGKIYIGEAKNLKRRMNYYNCQIDEPRPITRAFKKYGFDAFDYYVMESFPIGTPKRILLDREEFWINFYQTLDQKIGYNICPRGTDGTGRICKESTKLKISKGNTGKKRSEDVKTKLSKMRKGERHWQYGKSGPETSFWGKKLSDSHKKALLDANVGIPKFYNRRKIHQVNPKTGEIIATWDSVREAAMSVFGIRDAEKRISRVLIGCRKKYKGFSWIYAETPKTITKREATQKFKL